MDISQIPETLLLARGRYSTLRAMHEDEMKRMQILCGQLQAGAAYVLKLVQPADDSEAIEVSAILQQSRSVLDQIEESAKKIAELAAAKAALKPIAWPR
jgi:hypothetical protein